MGKHLTREEARDCARAWRDRGDKAALDRMVDSCMGYATALAAKFQYTHVPTDDLVQEARVGLVLGCQKYDPENGAALLTYVTFWIRAMMFEYVLRTHGPVRIGQTRAHRIAYFQLGRAQKALRANGEAPTLEELAAQLKVKPEDLAEVLPHVLGHNTLSLDQPVPGYEEEKDMTVGNMLAHRSMDPDPEETLAEREDETWRRRVLFDGLRTLNRREREIVRRRYLVDEPESLEGVGKHFGLTRERVRQVEEAAVEKLRLLAQRAQEAA